MADYLNEHEQVEVIKAFWQKYGSFIIMLIIIVILGMGASRFWQIHQQGKIAQASATYQAMLGTLSGNPTADISSQAEILMSHDQRTPYASLAALLLAAQQVNANQFKAAIDSLNWVIRHSNTSEFREIATVRKARILLAQGQAQQALDLVKNPPKGFEVYYSIVAGDADVALQKYNDAYQAYQTALNGLSDTDPYVGIIRLKLSNLPVNVGQMLTLKGQKS